jgi:ubiquinone/menaquinone biosynthesis C-methylase UbiE
MSFLMALIYDRAMTGVEEACLREWRTELLGQVEGRVLEIGAGTGATIELYPAQVTRLVLSEPDAHMRKRLERRVEQRAQGHIEVIAGSAERIEAADESFDFAVSTLVCCSVGDLHASLLEIRRVLRPGGSLVFLEHVAAAPGTSRRRWQNWLTPIWRRLMGNCHLNRETERAIVDSGFEIRQIERESMRKAPPFARPTIRGIAVKSTDGS